MNRWITASIVICCSFSAAAKEQQLVYDQDADVYKLSWDDARIATTEMREIAVLSRFVDYAPEFSIGVSAARAPSGKIITDKVFLAPALELCIKRPGNPCNRNPDKPDELFLKNAALNLRDARDQLAKLRAEKIPRVLEPVRAYLLEHLQRSAERERTRYDYLQSGDPTPLRKLLCRECNCTAGDERLLERLRAEPDPRSWSYPGQIGAPGCSNAKDVDIPQPTRWRHGSGLCGSSGLWRLACPNISSRRKDASGFQAEARGGEGIQAAPD